MGRGIQCHYLWLSYSEKTGQKWRQIKREEWEREMEEELPKNKGRFSCCCCCFKDQNKRKKCVAGETGTQNRGQINKEEITKVDRKLRWRKRTPRKR